MKILLVEDQKMASEYIAKGLRENDFVVDVAGNGIDGLHYLLTTDYDLAILDVMLPGIDGWKIIEMARQAGKQTPIMFLPRGMTWRTGFTASNWARKTI
ncbi:Transcriptional regulatory protein CusR [Cedecea neteri]|uniref:Transcriptional regulatory protein CusR n=1 Tax=Cedecea neteri TaxID=158822 RepID=A0A2X3JFP6_9ENTR|nr:Transcriptional regulatory protein CusR [Cedecea neteri]